MTALTAEFWEAARPHIHTSRSAGDDWEATAERIGVTKKTLLEWRYKETRQEFTPSPKADNHPRNANVVELLLAGLSYTEVGRRLGVSRGVVAGVDHRRKHRRIK